MRSILLVCDAIINLLLGIPLMIAPGSVASLLGLPFPGSGFYAGVLGAVLTGIGVAIVVQVLGKRWQLTGLSLEGAVCINVFGAVALAVWLLVGDLETTSFGRIFLWGVAVLVFFVSVLELGMYLQAKKEHKPAQEP